MVKQIKNDIQGFSSKYDYQSINLVYKKNFDILALANRYSMFKYRYT